MEKAKRIFATNKEAKELHVTADGHHFFDKHHAQNHASTQKDKAVKTITREEAEAFVPEEPKKEQKPAKESKPAKEETPKKEEIKTEE